MEKRRCVVIGGGEVGTRKTETLVSAGAKVTVISPKVSERIRTMGLDGSVEVFQREYKKGDLEGFVFCFAATHSPELNKRIWIEASERGILCNIADKSAPSDFIVPSVVERGDLTIAVSTGGNSPALAKKIRKDLESMFDDAYERLLKLLAVVRRVLLENDNDSPKHKRLFTAFVESGILEALREEKDIEPIISEIFGKEPVIDTLLKEIRDHGTPPRISSIKSSTENH